MEHNTKDQVNNSEKEESLEITQNQRIFLTISDFLIIVVIVVDLFYFGDLLPIAPGNVMIINVVSIIISFVGYQTKKRIRKINRIKKRAMTDSTPQ